VDEMVQVENHLTKNSQESRNLEGKINI